MPESSGNKMELDSGVDREIPRGETASLNLDSAFGTIRKFRRVVSVFRYRPISYGQRAPTRQRDSKAGLFRNNY
jgi:hypothetical protein